MEQYLVHHGIKGQKWGIRRYQNEDGTLTQAGRARYSLGEDGASANDKSGRKRSGGTAGSTQKRATTRAHNRQTSSKAPGSESANSYYNKNNYRAKTSKEYDQELYYNSRANAWPNTNKDAEQLYQETSSYTNRYGAEKRDNKKNYGLSKPGEPNRQAPASDSLQNDRLRNQQREQLWDTKQNTVRNRKADTKLPGSETMPRGNQPDYRVGYGTQSYQKGPYETVEYDEYRMVDAKTGESVSAWDEDILKSKVNKDVWANAGIPWSANSKTLDNYITQFADRMESNRNSARYNNSADDWNAARKAAQTVNKNSSTTLDKIGSAVNSAVKAGTDWLKKVIGKK